MPAGRAWRPSLLTVVIYADLPRCERPIVGPSAFRHHGGNLTGGHCSRTRRSSLHMSAPPAARAGLICGAPVVRDLSSGRSPPPVSGAAGSPGCPRRRPRGVVEPRIRPPVPMTVSWGDDARRKQRPGWLRGGPSPTLAEQFFKDALRRVKSQQTSSPTQPKHSRGQAREQSARRGFTPLYGTRSVADASKVERPILARIVRAGHG
jgi:hypothetical protein